MPSGSTSKAEAPARKPNAKMPANKSVVKKKRIAAAKARPATRVASASKATAAAKKPTPSRRKPVATTAAKPRGRKAAAPATVTVGDTQYVLGEYGTLMSLEEYERMMAMKSSG
jgi:hypothetical protein